ncbi:REPRODUCTIVE MERISTEM 39, REDUCED VERNALIZATION RESPONSE 1 [Hibiscus trionum]|uniref:REPRODUCTIVE MERISTEM 39, REDUCED VERNALIZATION RESPONSE 1 n=1 Tax=Hibiscus trionum TaxID=183268 RepID=A0A9W7MQ79_HIBTR|nr:REPRODUCTIVE MERISTEM 39, REDUCED VERNALIZATION RESPONSE 1 [Hibiscus trionum]
MASLLGGGHQPHHFFKIVLEEATRSGKLGIPASFVRDYGNNLSNPVFFKVPNGEIWELELVKCDGKMWFGNGWLNFAEHYSVAPGHFLAFRYEGGCHFHVIICDRTATEIEYPGVKQQVKIEKSVNIINGISNGSREKPELQCPRPHKTMRPNVPKFEPMPAGSSAGTGEETRPDTVCREKSDGKSMALQRVRSAFKSTNPFFLVFMQPSYVGRNTKKGCFVGIPTEFSRLYLKDRGDVVLCDSNGKTWATEYMSTIGRNGRAYVRLCNGWDAFVGDKNIQVGDVCAFELINRREISFKVFIFEGKKSYFHGSQAFTDVPSETGTLSSTHRQCQQPLEAGETAFGSTLIARETAVQKALAFTSENPYFVVVLRASYVNNSLCIPHHFSRIHFESTTIDIDIDLCLSNGKSWPAKYHQRSNIRSPNGRICNGWRAFVDDNNLQVGDVCVLEMTDHNAKISFKVHIFQAIADANCHPWNGFSEKPLCSTPQSPKVDTEMASTSRSPLFKRVVLPLHLMEKRLGIPYAFVEQYLKADTKMVRLKVEDRWWPVKITSNHQHRQAKFTRGWIEFARDNLLRQGDICVYELDTVVHGLLKVSISRSCH